MLSESDRKKAADILMAAEKERKQAVQLSKTWPNITVKGEAPADAKEFDGQPGKLDKYFSAKPGSAS